MPIRLPLRDLRLNKDSYTTRDPLLRKYSYRSARLQLINLEVLLLDNLYSLIDIILVFARYSYQPVLEIREEINRRTSNRGGGLRGRIAGRRGSRIRVLSTIIYTGAIAISLSLKEAEFVTVSEV
jgi:hypothetical protein